MKQDDARKLIMETWGAFGADYVPYRILMLSKLLDRHATQQVRGIADISLAEWRVLAHLNASGKQSASEISSAALVDRAEVSRAVKRLEQNKYLKREPNPANKISFLLKLTSKGKTVCDRIYAARRGFFSEITKALSSSDLKKLDHMIYDIAAVAYCKLDEM